MGEGEFPYRSLSSVAKLLLPEAEEMHRQGIPWRLVAKELRVSYSTLFNWRRLMRQRRTQSI